MKKVIAIIVFAIISISVSAQRRDIKMAKKIAAEFVKHNEVLGKISFSHSHFSDHTEVIMRKIGNVSSQYIPFYVLVDSLNPSSYIIVSSDERMKTVLAYGENASWNENDIPEGLCYLLSTYQQQYELLLTDNISRREKLSSISIPEVSPLLSSSWHQEYPYNKLCPEKCPSGCVATAMSQVMKYHQYPSTGSGSFSYTSRTRKFRCSYDFSSASFDWNTIKNSYSTSTISSQNTESISQLTYACGVSVGMDYNTNASGAYMSDVPYAMINFFGYNKNVSFRDRTYYASEEWYQMLCNELVNGRPVIYGGVDSKEGGHAFVIDGCSSDSRKFHVNWGWGGKYDGYYELDALDPQTYKFSSYQDMVINISPDIVGEFEDIFYADKFSVSSKIEFEKSLIFTISDVYCFSSQSSYVVSKAKFYGTIGVGIFDKDFNFVCSIGTDSIEGCNNFYGWTKLTYNTKLKKDMFSADGTYYIAPFVKERESEIPTRIRTSDANSDFIELTIDKDDINSNGEVEEPIEVLSEWREDFEQRFLPTSWKQEIELGKSEWSARYVLKASDDVPAAAHGKGYVYINHSAGLDLNNSRTVTRLISPIISLQPENNYNLTFFIRKQSTQPESTDILTIYYKESGEWQLLKEVAVTSQGDWHKTVLELPELENIQMAFEGSPAKGSSILLDDIRIVKSEETSSVNQITTTFNGIVKIYDLTGKLLDSYNENDLNCRILPKGIYIIKNSYKTSKISIK